MEKMATTICVPTDMAQIVRKDLEENKLWDNGRKLVKIGNSVAIPVLALDQSDLVTVIQRWPAAEVMQNPVVPSVKTVMRKNGQKLTDSMRALLTSNGMCEDLLLEVPKKWEKHGDLIILPSNSFASPQWNKLGKALWQQVADALSCQRVARHSHVADDDFRSPQVSVLLGDNGHVIHIDNGIKYSFDVTKCMFSSGNVTEKLRVASWDCSKEMVVDLYAGIGYFTLPYLVHAKAGHVHACEWNPDAVAALRHNLVLNGVEDRCTVHHGDNRRLQLSNVADRVNLGLIPSSEDGWRVAVRVLKDSGGILHIHQNVTVTTNNTLHADSQHIKDAVSERIAEKVCEQDVKGLNELDEGKYGAWIEETCGRIKQLLTSEKKSEVWVDRLWTCQVIHVEKVKSYAPRIHHIVLDLKCVPST